MKLISPIFLTSAGWHGEPKPFFEIKCVQTELLFSLSCQTPGLSVRYIKDGEQTKDVYKTFTTGAVSVHADSGTMITFVGDITYIYTGSSESTTVSYLNVLHLPHLQYLRIGQNTLGSIDLSDLRELLYVACGSGTIESLIATELPMLKTLDLSYNPLASLDLQAINALGVDFVYFRNSSVSEFSAEGLSNLKILDCENTPIEDSSEASISLAQSLVSYSDPNSATLLINSVNLDEMRAIAEPKGWAVHPSMT